MIHFIGVAVWEIHNSPVKSNKKKTDADYAEYLPECMNNKRQHFDCGQPKLDLGLPMYDINIAATGEIRSRGRLPFRNFKEKSRKVLWLISGIQEQIEN